MRDHAEKLDDTVQTFKSYAGKFTCIPNQTSNYDVFRLTNHELSDHRAETIWQYYRELFINAKLAGEGLSSFRKTLQRFIENKSVEEDVTNSDCPRSNDINRYIGLARWLELQYNVDTTIDQLSEGWTQESLEKAASRILGTVPFDNYVSYFSNDIHTKLKDPTNYDTRKLLLKNIYNYTHKQIRWYICASEYGAVKIWVHTRHNPFLQQFEKQIQNGISVNVVTSKILCNIDESTPYIKIENFFIDN